MKNCTYYMRVGKKEQLEEKPKSINVENSNHKHQEAYRKVSRKNNKN